MRWHQIKGSSASFGFPEIGESGARLEVAANARNRPKVVDEVTTLRRLIGPAHNE